MILEPIAFWGLAVVLLASALAVVLTRNLFHSVLYLALMLTATSGLFLSLDAEFLDSTGLALVVRWTREAPGLTIVRCSQPVWRLLEITAMTHLVR